MSRTVVALFNERLEFIKNRCLRQFPMLLRIRNGKYSRGPRDERCEILAFDARTTSANARERVEECPLRLRLDLLHIDHNRKSPTGQLLARRLIRFLHDFLVMAKKQIKDLVSTTSASLKWPPLHPLRSLIDLSLEVVLDQQIVLIRDLFTSSLCRKYVAFLSTLPLVTTPGQPKKGEALRVNDRFQIEDSLFAQQLWTRTGLKELVTQSDEQWGGEVCGLNPRIRVYRYRKNQFFDQHCT